MDQISCVVVKVLDKVRVVGVVGFAIWWWFDFHGGFWCFKDLLVPPLHCFLSVVRVA